MVNTKKVEQRVCRYRSLDELSSELDRIEGWHQEGTLIRRGNWSEGMIFEHIALVFGFSMDGYPFKFAAPGRMMTKLLFKKKVMNGGTFPAGIKPPPKFMVSGDAAAATPSESTTFEQGIEQLRSVIARVHNGEQMTQPSPIFGPLTHQEGIRKQLAHAELHLSFLDTNS